MSTSRYAVLIAALVLAVFAALQAIIGHSAGGWIVAGYPRRTTST